MEELSTFEIIGERYLDTQHSAGYIERLETELVRRGVVGVILEVSCAAP